MPRSRALTILILILAGSIGCRTSASVRSPSKPDELSVRQKQARDAAVLNAALAYILDDSEAHLEVTRERKPVIALYVPPPEPRGVGLMPKFTDQKRVDPLTPEQKAALKEAERHLAERAAAGESPTEFRPANPRVIRVTREERGDWHQHFAALPPGYAQDGKSAMVWLPFTWSSNFHGADALLYLERVDGDWRVKVRQYHFHF
ncbi:MAG: hypothetical protein ACK47B_13950 [Armatimonadota bacterium]